MSGDPAEVGNYQAYPSMQGILADQPAVVADAGALLQESGVADRCRVVGGDLFGSLPPGGDAYLLKLILHDWPDEQALEILTNVRKVMTDTGRLLLVEHVIIPGNVPQPAKLLDLVMLVLPGGREHTRPEWEELLRKANFALERILPTAVGVSLIEARPV